MDILVHKRQAQENPKACHKWHNVRLAKISENAILRLMAACTVSFVDLDGIRHSVEVEAEGLYEASVLGLCAFRKHEIEPGGLTQLEVEVRSSVKHTLTVIKVSRVVAAWREDSQRSGSERPTKNADVSVIASVLFSIFQNQMSPLHAQHLLDSYLRAVLEKMGALLIHQKSTR